MNGHILDWYRGATAFLVCSGPSLPSLADKIRDRPGILTMGVNQSAAVFRPDLWNCLDLPDRFHDRIWRDPRIRKFVPSNIACRSLKRQADDGSIVPWDRKAIDCPGVVPFLRSYGFNHETWLQTEEVECGPMEGEPCSVGITGGRSIMLSALKILYMLGIRRVFMVGADFRMEPERPYATNEPRKPGQIADNNDLFRKVNARLGAALPIAEDRYGFVVRNCTPYSGLTSVPYANIDDALAGCEQFDGPCVTEGWYYPQFSTPN